MKVDAILEMVNIIRMYCHYSDEYILDKSLLWVQSTHELCLRQIHDERIALTRTLLHEYACAMSGDDTSYMKSYAAMKYEMKQEESVEKNSEESMLKPERMGSLRL